jgi:microcin C transport system substrate-binding protein
MTLGFCDSLVLGAALVVTSASGLAAEAHDPVTVSHGYSDFAHLDYVDPAAPKGGEISQWSFGTFDSFNPYARKGNQAALSSIPFETVMTSFADDATASYCFLCTTVEYPESLDWAIFTLRDDVRFSDGSALTAEDVKFSFNLFMEQGLPSYRAAVSGMVAEIEILSPLQIKFTFTEDAPRRDVIDLAGGIPVFSKAWFESTGARLDDSSLIPFIGTGPYLLESYEVNQRVIYARRDDYWGEALPANIGRNNFDRIRMEYFADSAAAFEGFKGGLYTFRSENSSKQWATSYDFASIEAGHVVKTELPDGNLAMAQAYVFNLRREKFQDRRVREALAMMFNFEWSNAQLFYGLYKRVQSFWGNSELEARGVPTEGERAVLQPLVDQGMLSAEILTDEAVMAPVSGQRQLDRKNLRRASQLMDEAGWRVNADGMREKDGQVFTLEVLDSSPAFDRITNPMIENMKALGIDARLNRVDTAQESERTRAYDFDVTTHSMRMGFEPSSGLEQYFGTKAMDQSSRNLMGLSDPAVDALIEKVVRAQSKAELNTNIRALDRVLRAKRFWIPQWFKAVHTVAYYDQYGHPDPLPPFARGELDFWWFDAEKAAKLEAAGVLN